MIRAELLAVTCIDHGRWLLLAFTLTVLTVGAMRKTCRRIFGAQRALQLWLLPPMAMLATQLPQVARVASTFPLAPDTIAWAATLPKLAPGAEAFGLHACILAAWCIGMIATLCLALHAQRRFRSRLHGAVIVAGTDSRWPVLRAAHTDVGPALVGAWRVRIVLPSDFSERYDAVEQALILSHETTHARRRDGLWSLLAQVVCAMFWFHPLAWMALAALRLDQELACDAVVLRQHGAHPRRYADALLKTQVAGLALPVGCSWSPRHPVTERIAMLKVHPPGSGRQLAGAVVLVCLLTGFTGAVYALTQSAKAGSGAAAPTGSAVAEYQLDVYAQKSSSAVSGGRIERATLALCTATGSSGSFKVGDWKVRTAVVADGAKGVQIALSILDANDAAVAQSRGHTSLGQALHADLASPDGKDHFAFVVTPLNGCPARGEAAASAVTPVSSVTLAQPRPAPQKR